MQWNGKIHRRERRADVRGHIVIAFRRVDKKRITIANEPAEKGVEIAAHIGIGVFLDQ